MKFEWIVFIVFAASDSATSTTQSRSSSWVRRCAVVGMLGCAYMARNREFYFREHSDIRNDKSLHYDYRMVGQICLEGRDDPTFTPLTFPLVSLEDSDRVIRDSEVMLRQPVSPEKWLEGSALLYSALRVRVNQFEYPILLDSSTRDMRELATINTRAETAMLEWDWWLARMLRILQRLEEMRNSEKIQLFRYQFALIVRGDKDVRRWLSQVGLDPGAADLSDISDEKFFQLLDLAKSSILNTLRTGSVMISHRYQSGVFEYTDLDELGRKWRSWSPRSHCDVLDDWTKLGRRKEIVTQEKNPLN